MGASYIELRKASARGSDSLAADLTRHLHSRQYLGKTLVLCDKPAITLGAMHKQWLKLTRVIQKQRASTLNADKILKYTHTITHMQRLDFTIKPPETQPNADVYVLGSEQATRVPPQCWSTYICMPLDSVAGKSLVAQTPDDALIVDYRQQAFWETLGLAPKKQLEHRVEEGWRQASSFLAMHHIDISGFAGSRVQNVEAIDNALDILLTVSHKFLAVAGEFQRILELARPIKLTKPVRERYDSFILLAHRVQALCPSPFTQRFLQMYNEDDTIFLLHDAGKQYLAWSNENLAEAIARHTQAGRTNLAKALQALATR